MRGTPGDYPPIEGTLIVDKIPAVGEELMVGGQSLGRVITAPTSRQPKTGREAYTVYRVETTQGVFRDVQLPREIPAPELPAFDAGAEVKRLLGRTTTPVTPAPELPDFDAGAEVKRLLGRGRTAPTPPRPAPPLASMRDPATEIHSILDRVKNPELVQGTIVTPSLPAVGEQFVIDGEDLGRVLSVLRIDHGHGVTAYTSYRVETTKGVFKDVQLPRE